jgi:hypothetical protein
MRPVKRGEKQGGIVKDDCEAYPRRQAGRAYARALEVVGYVVAVLGTATGIIQMLSADFFSGLGYVLGSLVSGIGLVVLGELVLVFFNIEYNTMFLRRLEERTPLREHEGQGSESAHASKRPTTPPH